MNTPNVLEVISGLVNDDDSMTDILDALSGFDEKTRRLCLQIYELRQMAKAISDGDFGVPFATFGCMAMYLKNIADMLKSVELAIKELAEGDDTPELPRLGSLSTYCELISHTLQENRHLIEKYRNLSLTDMLTGLPNRRGFHTLGEKSLARAKRKGHVLSFIMADIDCFKQINDAHGHETGDEVLRSVAHSLIDGLRMEDICCRYGGEEFLILLYDTGRDCATLVAERLRKSVAESPVCVGDAMIPVTISLGVSELVCPGNEPYAIEIRQAIETADALLYTAKRAGKNRVAAEEPKPTA